MAPSATPPVAGDGSTSQAPSVPALPESIVSIRSILDEKVDPTQLVSLVGIVKDFSPPIKSRGTDYKAKIWLYDASLQESEVAFEFSIFRLEESHIPKVGPGDVVFVQFAKVQRYRSDPLSCITNRHTRIHHFNASQIPRPPVNAACALVKGHGHAFALKEPKILQYISALYHSIDKARVPDHEAFKVASSQALHVKEKFQELRNINADTFFDFIVQVVKQPFDMGDCLTLWVTDFTENDAFYPFSEHGSSDGLYADPMGYTRAGDPGWEGPLGRMSLQITCWEPHASAIRGKVTTGAFIRLRNVQVKFGRNGANLEGFLRQDRLYKSKVNVEVLNIRGDRECVDPRLKALIRRKRDYTRAKQASEEEAPNGGEPEKHKSEDEASNNGKHRRGKKGPKEAAPREEEAKKRKAEGEAPKNSKARRLEERARLQAQKNSSHEDPKDMNPDVTSEDIGVRAVPVSSIFEPVYHNITKDGEGPIRVILPFSNIKYRVIVRVVDFRPNTLEEFAFPKKPSEFDMLTDDEDSSDDYVGRVDGSTRWEWRFKLQLEDASVGAGGEQHRVWVSVDNPAAQCLIDLDASNLKDDNQGLANLRSQMFKLWGNLEERKKELAKHEASKSKGLEDQPADDSEEEAPLKEQPKKLDNMAFSCCLKQYGTKTAESDPDKADAGEGKRWERRYALSGARMKFD